MIFALQIFLHILAIKQYVLEFAAAVHLALVVEMFRCRIAALPADKNAFCLNARAEFNRRDKAVADFTVESFGGASAAHAK